MISLPVWMPGPMFLLGESLSLVPCSFQEDLCPGALCLGVRGGVCLCPGGVSVQGDFCLGGSLVRGVSVSVSRGSLSRKVSVQGGLCPWGLYQGDPLDRDPCMVKCGRYILLEFFLVSDYILVEF